MQLTTFFCPVFCQGRRQQGEFHYIQFTGLQHRQYVRVDRVLDFRFVLRPLHRTVSTPFIFRPRTRPSVPLPSPLTSEYGGFRTTPEWRMYESFMRVKSSGGQDITYKLYIPASRIFCVSQRIPFHLTLESSAFSLASFLPFGPATSQGPGKPKCTRIQLMRQSIVDVRCVTKVIVSTVLRIHFAMKKR